MSRDESCDESCADCVSVCVLVCACGTYIPGMPAVSAVNLLVEISFAPEPERMREEERERERERGRERGREGEREREREREGERERGGEREREGENITIILAFIFLLTKFAKLKGPIEGLPVPMITYIV